MLAEGLRAGPNENSMQTLRQRFYSAVIMPPLWQMKTSVAGRENNEVIKKRTGHGAWSAPPPPPSCNPIGWRRWEGSPAKMMVKHWLDCRVALFDWKGKMAVKDQTLFFLDTSPLVGGMSTKHQFVCVSVCVPVWCDYVPISLCVLHYACRVQG